MSDEEGGEVVSAETPVPTEEVVVVVEVMETPVMETEIEPAATEEEEEKKATFIPFGSKAKTIPDPQPANANILWGAAAAAAIGAFNAAIAEKKRKEEEARRRAEAARNSGYAKRRAAEKEGKLDEYLREKNMTDRERKHRRELQKIWDANGAAIYEANQDFKTAHGKEMDSATRNKAIAEATVGGVFNAGLYSDGLVSAAQAKAEKAAVIQAAVNEIEAEKNIGYVDPEVVKAQEERAKQEKLEEQQAVADWKQADMRATDEEIRLPYFIRQSFDPYIGAHIDKVLDGTFYDSELHANLEALWKATSEAYSDYNIDVNALASSGSQNPLEAWQVREQMEGEFLPIEYELLENQKHVPYNVFLDAVDSNTGGDLYLDDSLMQYESHYLAALMEAHPDVLEQSMLDFKDKYADDNNSADAIQNLIEKMRFPWSGGAE